jgi:hypothetical protein
VTLSAGVAPGLLDAGRIGCVGCVGLMGAVGKAGVRG